VRTLAVIVIMDQAPVRLLAAALSCDDGDVRAELSTGQIAICESAPLL
jgi:hypothetical protein